MGLQVSGCRVEGALTRFETWVFGFQFQGMGVWGLAGLKVVGLDV